MKELNINDLAFVAGGTETPATYSKIVDYTVAGAQSAFVLGIFFLPPTLKAFSVAMAAGAGLGGLYGYAQLVAQRLDANIGAQDTIAASNI